MIGFVITLIIAGGLLYGAYHNRGAINRVIRARTGGGE